MLPVSGDSFPQWVLGFDRLHAAGRRTRNSQIPCLLSSANRPPVCSLLIAQLRDRRPTDSIQVRNLAARPRPRPGPGPPYIFLPSADPSSQSSRLPSGRTTSCFGARHNSAHLAAACLSSESLFHTSRDSCPNLHAAVASIEPQHDGRPGNPTARTTPPAPDQSSAKGQPQIHPTREANQNKDQECSFGILHGQQHSMVE